MNAALRADPTALRVNLTVPTTAVRIGPFSFDGLKALVGMDLAEALAPLMIGPKYQRPGGSGVVDVYPLAIPEGEGLSLPVKLMGELGFYNLSGALVLIVPPAVVDVVTAQLATEIAAGEALGPRFTAGASGGTVAEFAVRLRAGMRKAVPLGRFGEIGVEAR
ncbi:MAG: hypothetical protein Q8P18_03660 [Pseudomonadota bacterium]|nr:hypothetical protein [Pseudomonadota bacterium]